MKLLLVSPYFLDSYKNRLSMGSAVKIARNLSRFHQVYVLTTGRTKPLQKLSTGLTVESVSGWLVPDPVNYMISPAILWRFAALLTEFKPDVVIVSKYMFFSSLVIPIAKHKGLKVITVTDTFPGINWFSTSRLTSAVMWLYARLIGIPLLQASDKVILLYPGLESIARRYGLNYVTIDQNSITENTQSATCFMEHVDG